MTKLITFALLTEVAQDKIRSGEYQMRTFNKTFAEDPQYAFEWAADAFDGAARQWIGRQVLAWIANAEKNEAEEATTVAQIVGELHRTVRRAARYPERSTSVQHNAAVACKHAAVAEFLESIGE